MANVRFSTLFPENTASLRSIMRTGRNLIGCLLIWLGHWGMSGCKTLVLWTTQPIYGNKREGHVTPMNLYRCRSQRRSLHTFSSSASSVSQVMVVENITVVIQAYRGLCTPCWG